ncbi:hypothetical protein CIG75_18955 [Tumebacillus algifaecis]|uniref:Uncharacterized protein n=1 Tax=Tumebacillus algifaecis TaxID=1214604 RepID=A0A223D611_9BACL|nr:hypothetical protein [Tumebacillus algifaecis]ASS76814.1 hypothetical protein CIG75_18955 [Tumebacillus algifaecis]
MTASRIMRWLTGSLEIFLAIPALGALIVVSLAYVPLGIMFILHVVALILSARNKEPIYGSVLGIVTSLVAWIPFVGWVMHLLSGILIMVSAAQKSKTTMRREYDL